MMNTHYTAILKGQTDPSLIAEMRDLLVAAIDVLDAPGIVYGDSGHEPLDVLRVARALLARIDGDSPTALPEPVPEPDDPDYGIGGDR